MGNSHTPSQLAQKLRASTLEEQVLLLSPFVLPHSPVVCAPSQENPVLISAFQLTVQQDHFTNSLHRSRGL